MAVRTRRAAKAEEEKKGGGFWGRSGKGAHSGKSQAIATVATILLLAVLFFSWFRLVGGFTHTLAPPPPLSHRRLQPPRMALSGLPFSPVFLVLASSQSPATLGVVNGNGAGGGGSSTVMMLAGAGGAAKGGSTDALAGLEDELVEEFGALAYSSSSTPSSKASASNDKRTGVAPQQQAQGQQGQQQSSSSSSISSREDPLNAMLSGQGARGRSIEPRAHSL